MSSRQRSLILSPAIHSIAATHRRPNRTKREIWISALLFDPFASGLSLLLVQLFICNLRHHHFGGSCIVTLGGIRTEGRQSPSWCPIPCAKQSKWPGKK